MCSHRSENKQKTTMAQPLLLNMDPNKVTCPHCQHPNCFEEASTLPQGEVVNSYMCLNCGYTTTTLNVEKSVVIEEYEKGTAELIKALRWVDPQTSLVWYPIVLNFPSTGMIFPDGVDASDWKWMVAPAVSIPLNEQKKYPIKSQPGSYYTKKIDLKKGKLFAPNAFYEAAKSVGFIQEAQQVD